MLEARRLWVRFSIIYMALGSTQPLTLLSTRNLLGGVKGGQPACKDDNLIAIRF
jgi:hypothetical protein